MSQVKEQRARSRVSCGRISGKVLSWQSKEGWITPDKKVDHEFASKFNGRIYIKQSDVGAGQPLSPGASVDFLVYADTERLGAEFCRITPPASKQPATPAGMPTAKAKAGAVPVIKTIQKNKVVASPVSKLQAPPKKAAGTQIPKAPAPKAIQPVAIMKTVPKAVPVHKVETAGKGAGKGKTANASKGQPAGKGTAQPASKGQPAGKGTAQPAGKGAAQPASNTMPRKPLPLGRQKGQVTKWMGKYGWIKPQQPITHNASSRHNGNVYLQAGDVQQGQAVSVGSEVDFLLYEDSSGLGAHNCRIVGAGAESNLGRQDIGKGATKGAGSNLGRQDLGKGATKGAGSNLGRQDLGKGATKGAGKAQAAKSTGVQKTIVKVLTPTPKPKAKAANASTKLPPLWEEHWSEEYGVPYYWNSKTKDAVWIKPT